MPSLDPNTLAGLLAPYLQGASVPDALYAQLSTYLDLLLKWNAKTNLTAVREPEEIVRRHFGESLFTGWNLPEVETVLDFGSGAGFPGLPIQLLRPDLRITLAESQNKKASFLREVVRALVLPTEIWADRVEAMPDTQTFDLVVMRAVDNMPAAIHAALPRAGRYLVIMSTARQPDPVLPSFAVLSRIAIPRSSEQQILLASRL